MSDTSSTPAAVWRTLAGVLSRHADALAHSGLCGAWFHPLRAALGPAVLLSPHTLVEGPTAGHPYLVATAALARRLLRTPDHSIEPPDDLLGILPVRVPELTPADGVTELDSIDPCWELWRTDGRFAVARPRDGVIPDGLPTDSLPGGRLVALVPAPRGLPLTGAIRVGIPLVELVRLLREAAGALAESGEVHGDIKPAWLDVFASSDGEGFGWRARLRGLRLGRVTADFLLGPGGRSLDPLWTLALAKQGAFSPLYAAPERRAGVAPTPACDVYSLGMVAAQALLGRPDAVASDALAALDDPAHPAELRALLRRCLDESPALRLPDAAALAAELAALPEWPDAPALSRPSWPLVCLWNEAERHRTNSEYAEAEAALAELFRLVPPYPAALVSRAECRRKTGDLAAALADCDAAARLDPDSADALAERGAVRLAQKDYAGAIPDLERAAAMDPESVYALRDLGTAMRFSGRLAEAVEVLTRALALRADDVEARCERACAHLTAGHPAEAALDAEEAIRLRFEWGYAWCLRGSARRRLGDFGGATADLVRALELDPSDAFAAEQLDLTRRRVR